MPGKEEPLRLSVCVPTYNRAALLKEALEALARQGNADIFAEVEVLVSDNASTDATQEVLARFQAEHPALPLHSTQHQENVGMDRNILSLVRRARGEYIWIISDDDLLLPGALPKLLGWIRVHPGAGAFSLNARPFRYHPEERTAPFLILKQDTQLSGPDEALDCLREWVTFISIMAFRRDLVEGCNYEERIGSTLITSFLFVDVLAAGMSFWVSREPLIALRAENSGGYNFFEVFVTNFALLMEYARTRGFSERTTRAVLLGQLRTYIRQNVKIFKLRGMIGGLTPDFADGIRRLWRVYHWHPVFLFQILPLLLLPMSLISRAYPLYRHLRHKGADQGPVEEGPVEA